ncbi:MAG: hypothetical protein OHK0015_41960 [Chloroflexi bacterium OHK40]
MALVRARWACGLPYLLIFDNCIERALLIRRRALGATHPDTISTERSLRNMRQAAGRGQPTATDPRERLAPLLLAVARVALGYQEPQAQVEQALVQLEQSGWMLRGPVERMWEGERELDALTAELDEQDTALVERMLELIGERELPAQALAAVPEAVRAAIVSNDGAALHAALTALPEAEAQAIIARLKRAGLLG